MDMIFPKLIEALMQQNAVEGPIIVHVITTKAKAIHGQEKFLEIPWCRSI